MLWVLTNNLPQPIVGLTVRWIRTDDQGNRPVANHSFRQLSVQQIADRSRQRPSARHTDQFQTPRPPGTHFIGATFRARGFNDRLDGSSGVTVSFDTIIFEDGHVLGPTNPELSHRSKQKRIGPRTSRNGVRQAMANGENVQALLRSLSSEPARQRRPPAFFGQLDLRER